MILFTRENLLQMPGVVNYCYCFTGGCGRVVGVFHSLCHSNVQRFCSVTGSTWPSLKTTLIVPPWRSVQKRAMLELLAP